MISFNTLGMDFVLTALFLVLLVEQFKATRNHRPMMIGLFMSVVALLIFDQNKFMIPALVLIIMSLLALRGKVEDYNE